jgi:hypothetical protein
VAAARPAPRPKTLAPNPFSPPICLYGNVVVEVGGEAQVPVGTISNNTGRPIEIREIRFSADSGDATYNFANLGGALQASISIGGRPVVRDPAPLWSLGRLENVVGQTLVTTINATTAMQYVWRLSRPLLLPPRCEISVKFVHPGIVNFAITGHVALLGRYVDRSDRVTAIPYVLAWRSKNVGIAAATDESDEKTLANTIGRAFQIDRIIARHAVLNSGSGAHISTNSALAFHDGRGQAYPGGLHGVVAPALGLLRLKLATSRNWQIIGKPTPIWDVFGMSGALEVPHVLPPGDFFKAYVQYYATDPELSITPNFAPAAPTTYQHALHLSFVGWREDTIL